MPEYRYKAIDNTGKLFSGTIVALSGNDVENRLGENGLTLVKTRQVKTGILADFLAGNTVKQRVLIEFYHRLAQTLELGLPILSALDENVKLLPSKLLKKIVGEIRVALEGGNTLYESMLRFPKVFQKLDLAIVRMGEQSGVLPKSLKELAEFLEWKEDIKSIIKRATIYPSFVLVVITAVIGVWVGYVLPKLAQVLSEMNVPLPSITQAVLKTSVFVQANWLWMILTIIALIFFLYVFQKTEKGGIIVHKYILKMPVFGVVATNIATARLSHNFATMYSAGITINNIFEILSDNVLGNRYLEAQLSKAFQEIQRGQSITEGFEIAGGFPPLLLGAIRNGETTGTLDDSFSRLGVYYDKEVKRTVEAMINAFEPATLLVLGGVFGLIVLSIMLPLYDVITDLGKAY